MSATALIRSSAKNTEDELFSTATHLLFKPDEGDGAIFTQRATVMLTQIFLAAREEGRAPLPYVREIIRSGLPATAERLNAISPDLATQFLDVAFWTPISRPLSSFQLGDALGQNAPASDRNGCPLPRRRGLSSRGSHERRARPVTVYLRWPERDLLALSPLVRLLWGSLIDGLITTYDKRAGKNCNPVLLLIDEAGRTAIPSLADHATTVVGRGISLWIAVQSLSQLDAVYGRVRAQVLRDNMEIQIYYRPSNHETAEYLERCLGRTSEYAHSQTDREGTNVSQGLSEQGVPLLTAGEIKQMRDEDIIGFHRRLPPFQGKRMDWRRFPHTQTKTQFTTSQHFSLTWTLKHTQSREESRSPLYIDPDMVH